MVKRGRRNRLGPLQYEKTRLVQVPLKKFKKSELLGETGDDYMSKLKEVFDNDGDTRPFDPMQDESPTGQYRTEDFFTWRTREAKENWTMRVAVSDNTWEVALQEGGRSMIIPSQVVKAIVNDFNFFSEVIAEEKKDQRSALQSVVMKEKMAEGYVPGILRENGNPSKARSSR